MGQQEPHLPAGALNFPFDPDEPADRTSPFWLPHVASGVVLLAPPPEGFPEVRNTAMLPPIFQDAASDGLYLILQNRIPVVLIGGATTATPAAVIIPLDNHFA